MSKGTNNSRKSNLAVLGAGAISGISVDAILFPIDTIKTRLQSKAGFLKSGGFTRLYSGLTPLLLGSMPSSAVFFISYETVRNEIGIERRTGHNVAINMLAASIGEINSCLVRVPCELLKQKGQTNVSTPLSLLKHILRQHGIIGMYRGYSATVMREIPFSLVQFPLWEAIKSYFRERHERDYITPLESICSGATAGGVAAAITTPIDVAKTRIMLSSGTQLSSNFIKVMYTIAKQEGVTALFSGLLPRMVQISMGGAIFLGIYVQALYQFNSLLDNK